jgi:hypothetical protein
LLTNAPAAYRRNDLLIDSHSGCHLSLAEIPLPHGALLKAVLSVVDDVLIVKKGCRVGSDARLDVFSDAFKGCEYQV